MLHSLTGSSRMGASLSKNPEQSLVVDTCREKKAIANAMKVGRSDATNLSGIPEFIRSNRRVFGLVALDMSRPTRESAEDYEIRVWRRMGILFASAPKELTIVRLRESSLTRALLRIESAANTKEIHVGINVQDGEDRALTLSAARDLLLGVCGEVRRTHRKKRAKTYCWEDQEKLYSSCGFKRLKTQESLKIYPEGHLKRFVAMEKRLLRWDDLKHILLVIALCRDGRATLITPGLSDHLSCVGKVMAMASEEAFWYHFISEALLFVYF